MAACLQKSHFICRFFDNKLCSSLKYACVKKRKTFIVPKIKEETICKCLERKIKLTAVTHKFTSTVLICVKYAFHTFYIFIGRPVIEFESCYIRDFQKKILHCSKIDINISSLRTCTSHFMLESHSTIVLHQESHCSCWKKNVQSWIANLNSAESNIYYLSWAGITLSFASGYFSLYQFPFYFVWAPQKSPHTCTSWRPCQTITFYFFFKGIFGIGKAWSQDTCVHTCTIPKHGHHKNC